MTAIENNQIKELSARIDGVTEHLTTLSTGVKEIKEAILGTEFNKGQAYMVRIENLEAFKTKVELRMIKAQIWGTMIGAGLLGSIELIFKYAQIFMKK